MTKFNYPVSIRPLSAEDGGGYLAEFADLPGCMADGESIEEALHEAEDALNAWLETAKKNNQKIPKPSVASEYSGQWRMRVPKSLHAKLALQAKKEGVSLNTYALTLLAQGAVTSNTESKACDKVTSDAESETCDDVKAA